MSFSQNKKMSSKLIFCCFFGCIFLTAGPAEAYFKDTVVAGQNQIVSTCWAPLNLDFESGDLTGWKTGEIAQEIKVVAGEVKQGHFMLRVGFPGGAFNPPGKNEIYQDFTACFPELIIAYNLFSADIIGQDKFSLKLLNLDREAVIYEYNSTAVEEKNLVSISGWQNQKIDISAYKGERLRLYLAVEGEADNFGPIWLYVDKGETVNNDVEAPVSRVVNLPTLSREAVFPVFIQGKDNNNGAGIAIYKLWYRHNRGRWQLFGEFNNIPILFDSQGAGGDGEYQFYSQAKDFAGNLESEKVDAESQVLVETTIRLPQDIQISEIMWSGSFLNSGDEWLEFYNQTTVAVNLAGWELTKKRSDGVEESMYVFPAGTTLEPKTYLVLAEYSEEFSALKATPNLIFGSPSVNESLFSLANDNLQLKLYDDRKQLIDVAGSGQGIPFAGNLTAKKSMQRRLGFTEGDLPESWFSCESQLCQDSRPIYWDFGSLELGTPGGNNL